MIILFVLLYNRNCCYGNAHYDKTYRYEIDWSYDYEIEIDLDEWVYFEVDYRGENSWHLIGHKCDDNYKWTEKELSYHWVTFTDMVDFIVKANNLNISVFWLDGNYKWLHNSIWYKRL